MLSTIPKSDMEKGCIMIKTKDIMYKEYISREYIKQNPNYLFVFGDNDTRIGFGGQAKEMRGEPNVVGIRVKKKPLYDEDAYYTDNELEDNMKKINEDIETIVRKYNYESKYEKLVFPMNGVGTGMAKLKEKAPQTYNHLVHMLKQFGIDNEIKNFKEKG